MTNRLENRNWLMLRVQLLKLRGQGYVAAVLFPLATGVVFSQAQAATIAAKSVSFPDVESAVVNAKDGDTVTVPAGTATWVSPLNIVNNITLQGAGEAATVIVDGIPHGQSDQAGESERGRPPPRQSSRPEKERKIRGAKGGEVSGVARARGHKRAGSLILANLERNLPFRLTGFTFRGNGEQRGNFNGEVRVDGNSHAFRIDHCTFDQLPGLSLGVSGFLWGVIDHCRFNLNGRQPIHISHQSWGGKDHGNGSWADDPFWGSEKFVFIEDNVFENIGKKKGIDAYEGARFVVRHNQFHNCGLSMHGTEASGRGGKQVEEYNNTYRNDDSAPAEQIRSGCIITHDNTWNDAERGHVLQVYRLFAYPQHWGYCNGENPYDDNAPNGATGYWATGTHTGASGATVLTDATKNWEHNQWYQPGAVYIVRNKTFEAAATNMIDKVPALIISNTAHSLMGSPRNHKAPAFGGTGRPLTFNAGDTYEIWKVAHALDQPGLGRGDLLTGLPGRPAKWPHEVSEPCYSWNNKLESGAAVNLSSTEPCIEEGRDFFNGTPKSGYKPFIYPHPLVSAASAPEARSR